MTYRLASVDTTIMTIGARRQHGAALEGAHAELHHRVVGHERREARTPPRQRRSCRGWRPGTGCGPAGRSAPAGRRARDVAQEQTDQQRAAGPNSAHSSGLRSQARIVAEPRHAEHQRHDRAREQADARESRCSAPCVVGWSSRSRKHTPSDHQQPIGTFTKNRSRQLQWCRMKPPRFGPMIPPIGKMLREQAEAPAPAAPELVADDADRRRHQPAAADRLQRPKGDEPPDRRREATEQRAEREDRRRRTGTPACGPACR